MASQNTQMCFSRWDPHPRNHRAHTSAGPGLQPQASLSRSSQSSWPSCYTWIQYSGIFFFLTSVLPLLYEIFSFFVVFKTFSSNRSKERAFWRRDDFSVTIFLKPYGLHFLQKEKEFSLLFLIAFSPKEKNKEKMQKHLFLLF